jgi:hypothetical protein
MTKKKKGFHPLNMNVNLMIRKTILTLPVFTARVVTRIGVHKRIPANSTRALIATPAAADTAQISV